MNTRTESPGEPRRTAADSTCGGVDGNRATLRAADSVMRLDRLGSMFPTRLSFTRSLVRRMARERWRIERERLALDANGHGHAVYAVHTPLGRVSFVAFSQPLDPALRTDRVIAERWDATFALSEGPVDDADIERLAANVPLQEAGRVSARELVLSRANKSVRLFEHVVERLACGDQPDASRLHEVGYLMRTTAVYGNGKFGLADLERVCAGAIFRLPFEAEMLTVYVAREFSVDLAEHVARMRAPRSAVALAPGLRRELGVGNATGLGMAPFLVTHPKLIERWILARERAFARVRDVEAVTPALEERLHVLLERAIAHLRQWRTGDRRQSERNRATLAELERIRESIAGDRGAVLARRRPWRALFASIEGRDSIETEELIVSLLLELHPERVDALESETGCDEDEDVEPGIRLDELRALVERDYAWALAVDFDRPASVRRFWYVSEEKEEPRLGDRGVDPGEDREMRIDVARQVVRLHASLASMSAPELERSVACWLLREPHWRGVVRRVQSLAGHEYAEIRANLLDADCVPIDLLRAKLSIFGASKFDPKSDRWTRITLFQGAPTVAGLGREDVDDWWLPVLGSAPADSPEQAVATAPASAARVAGRGAGAAPAPPGVPEAAPGRAPSPIAPGDGSRRTVSENEIVRLGRRVFQALGAGPGAERDPAMALAWLELHGLAGVEALDADSARVARPISGERSGADGGAVASIVDRSAGRLVLDAHGGGGAFAALAVVEWLLAAPAPARALLERVRSVQWLLPCLARHAGRAALAAVAEDAAGRVWMHAEASPARGLRCRLWCDAGALAGRELRVVAASGRDGPDAPSGAIVDLDAGRLERRRRAAVAGGTRVRAASWDRLSALARRALVPPSEASRARGAGGADDGG